MSLIARNVDTGALVADRVGVAATRAARAVGLLTRSGLDAGEALWIVPSRGVHTWGMRFAIDVVALDEQGVVVDCVPNLKPWRMRLPRAGTAGVLELPAGTLDKSGTAVGHRIAFETCGASGQERVPVPGTGDRSDSHPIEELRS